jgi:folate-binding protein YgfZ
MASLDVLSSEYRAVTERCGLLDRSERGKLALTGSGAREFLQGQVSNDVEALAPGEGCYAAFLTPKGKMLGDLRILDTGEELLLDTERVALQELFNVIRRFSIGFDVELHKRTLQCGLLSLLGPDSERVLDMADLPAAEHAHRPHQLAGVAIRVIRTDAGLDVLCDAASTAAVREALEQAGAEPVSEETAETLRVERGRPRYGIDLDNTVIPQEAGLNERAVSFTKGCYVGQETVARLFYRGKPNRHLRGLRLAGRVAAGEEIRAAARDGERAVGRVGSVAVSPAHGPIALALLRREVAPGDLVRVGEAALEASVVELPFARPAQEAL